MKPTFLAVTGPTASGKTELSLALAERLDGEIVSMDSRQVYRGMDIGTDTVARDARARVPHFGLDVIDPDERYSAGRFARDARRWIEEIRGRDHLPLVVGGTGFFLRALTEPIFTEPPMDAGRRSALRAWLATQPMARLAAWVRVLDPDRADTSIEGGPHRVGRTLEVALLTGRRLSWWHQHAPPDGPGVPGAVVRLVVPRDELDRRIAARVERMVERGLVDEVRGLLARGYGPDAPGMTGTGYREIAAHLAGLQTLEEALDEIRRNTRRYSRRQITWLRHQLPDGALSLDATLPLGSQVDLVERFWAERSGGGAS